MKRIAVSLISIILVFGLTSSCTDTSKDKIGFLYTSKITAKRFVLESQFFTERATQLGVEVIVNDADDDDILQIERASEMFDQGIKALVVIPVNGNTAAAIVREGNKRGIPVISYARIIRNCKLPLFIASDAKALGEIIVKESVKLKPKGNYVILGGGKDDNNAIAMHDGQIENLKPYIDKGDVNIIYDSYIEKYSPAICAFEFEQVLNIFGEDIDAVFPGYDGMATEVIRILKERNISDVFVSGQDAELNAVHQILDGDLSMTLFHPIDDIAKRAAELAVEIARKKNPESRATHQVFNGEVEVPSFLIPSIAITKDNIDEVLIARGFYTKEEVYKDRN